MEFSREEKTYPPRTMNEIEWDDTEHRFAGAKTKSGEELVMLERRWVEGLPDLYVIMCVDLEGSTGLWNPEHITPTGRRFRLVPETTEQDDAPEFDPAYTYSDRHGDVWHYEEEEWWCYQNHYRTFRANGTPPAEYGPYTRIEKEDTNE